MSSEIRRPVHDRDQWEQHPNIRGLAGMLLHIHDSFRATSKTLRQIAAGDDDSALERMAPLFRPLEATLHHHHQAEERMLFPHVQKKLGKQPQQLIDDHKTLMARLDEVSAQLRAGDRRGIDALVTALDMELCDHLDREEALVIPVLLVLSREEGFRLMYELG